MLYKLKTKLRGFKYASELCRPSDRRMSTKVVPNLWIEGVAWSAQRITTAVNLDFLNPEPYFSIQIDPQLYSQR
jgi:hypothetical protein